MGKEDPDWLKKSTSVARDAEAEIVKAQASYSESLKRLEEERTSRIESESKNAILALNRWRELRVDQLLEGVKSFMGSELTPTNIVFEPELIENEYHHIEPSGEGKGVFLSVGIGDSFRGDSDKPEDLVRVVSNLMSRHLPAERNIKSEDIKFLRVERTVQQVRFTTPDSNWGSSFSHKLVHNIFSLELNTNGFCASQNFRDCALKTETFSNVNSAGQLKEAVDNFISRVISTPPLIRPRVYESNR